MKGYERLFMEPMCIVQRINILGCGGKGPKDVLSHTATKDQEDR